MPLRLDRNAPLTGAFGWGFCPCGSCFSCWLWWRCSCLSIPATLTPSSRRRRAIRRKPTHHKPIRRRPFRLLAIRRRVSRHRPAPRLKTAPRSASGDCSTACQMRTRANTARFTPTAISGPAIHAPVMETRAASTDWLNRTSATALRRRASARSPRPDRATPRARLRSTPARQEATADGRRIRSGTPSHRAGAACGS